MAKSKKSPFIPPTEFLGLALTYKCGGTVKTVQPSITYEGGCFGGHGEGSYCYCPSIEIVAQVICDCGNVHKFDVYF